MILIAALGFLLVAVIMLAIKVSETSAPASKAPKVQTRRTTITAPGTVSEDTVAAVTERRLAEIQAQMKVQETEREKRLQDAQRKAQDEQRRKDSSTVAGAAGTGAAAVADGEEIVEPRNPRIKLFDPSRLGQSMPTSGAAGRTAAGTGTTAPAQPQPPVVTSLIFGNAGKHSPADGADRESAKGVYPIVDPARGTPTYEEVGRALRSGSTRSLLTPTKLESTRTSETYLPSGTFFRVTTMNGMDAPAGGQAQNNPQPVLMVVSDWGNMPNSFRANVKHCFVIGSAWGDLSAERAMARTENLSCIRPSGEVIDVPISGFVVGPDGRNGFRGRVVTKQGQVLANALWTGTLASFGDVAKQLNSNPIVIAGGVATQQSPTTSEIMRRGALGGMGEAAKTLSQYYINLADKLYPVIETEAGLTAEVILTRGTSIKDGQGQGANARGLGSDLSSLAKSVNLPSFSSSLGIKR
jgi:conjugal transfer pilus assembly protein TraB